MKRVLNILSAHPNESTVVIFCYRCTKAEIIEIILAKRSFTLFLIKNLHKGSEMAYAYF